MTIDLYIQKKMTIAENLLAKGSIDECLEVCTTVSTIMAEHRAREAPVPMEEAHTKQLAAIKRNLNLEIVRRVKQIKAKG